MAVCAADSIKLIIAEKHISPLYSAQLLTDRARYRTEFSGVVQYVNLNLKNMKFV